MLVSFSIPTTDPAIPHISKFYASESSFVLKVNVEDIAIYSAESYTEMVSKRQTAAESLCLLNTLMSEGSEGGQMKKNFENETTRLFRSQIASLDKKVDVRDSIVTIQSENGRCSIIRLRDRKSTQGNFYFGASK